LIVIVKGLILLLYILIPAVSEKIADGRQGVLPVRIYDILSSGFSPGSLKPAGLFCFGGVSYLL